MGCCRIGAKQLNRLILTVLVMTSLVYSTSWHALASVPESSLQLDALTLWQTSGVDGDAGYYLRQLDDFGASIGPYKYRVLPTLAVRLIRAVTGLPGELDYLIFNALCFIIAGTAFTHYLLWIGFRYPTALLGGVLAVTSIGIQSMMLLPMAEPASYIAAIAIVWSIHARRLGWFIVAASLGILIKEVFIVAIPVWFALEIQRSLDPRRDFRWGESPYGE